MTSADSHSAPPVIHAVPSQLGRYRVLRTIARGGMSVVYEVEEPERRVRYALKHLTVDSELARARFRREYQAMVRLIHPNIGRVFALDESDGFPWMTLEYLDGQAVGAFVDALGAPGTPERTLAAAHAMHALALALEHVHDRDLVHRDIKSGNVLVLPDGRVKLVDFGIAWVPGSEQEEEREEFVGTLAYAAPEQFRGDRPTAAADLYGVGCLFYRLLTGQRPFTGSTPAEMAKLHTSKPPTRPRSITPGIPAELERIVLRLMKKQPGARVPSAVALAHLLEDWLDTQPAQTLTVALDRGARRGIGRESAIETIQRTLSSAPAGTLVTLRGLAGSRHEALLDLVVDDAVARKLPTTRITHTDPGRFAALQAAGETRERAVVALADVHKWDSGSLRALDRSLAASATHAQGAVFLAAMALEARDLALDELVERAERDVVLRPLPLSDTRRLIGALLQRPPPPAASARPVHAATDGVPAYVEEVISEMIADGHLDGVRSGAPIIDWPLRTPDEVPIPEAATWAIDNALTSLDADGLRILEALAATRSPALLDDLIALSGTPCERPTRTLERLRSTGLVHRADTDDGVRLSWTRSVSARLIRARTPRPRARALARKALSSRQTWDPADHVRLARTAMRIESALLPAHSEARRLLDAGCPASALELVEPVAEELSDIEGLNRDRALVLLSCARALQQLRPSDPRVPTYLAHVRDLTDSPALLAECALVTARVHRALARNADARHKLGEAWTLCQQAAQPDLASQIAHDAGTAYLQAGHVSWAERWFSRSTRVAGAIGNAATQARAHVGQALLALHQGHLTQAFDLAEQAHVALGSSSNAHIVGDVLHVQATVLRLRGRHSEALARLASRGAPLEASEDPALAVGVHLLRAEVEHELGRLGWAQDALEQALCGMTGRDHTFKQLQVAILQARIHLSAGLVPLARETLPRLIHRARRAGMVRLARRAATTLARALAHDGDAVGAREHIDAVLAETTGTGDALGLIRIRRDELRGLSLLYPPESTIEALSGWPELADALVVQLDMHRARLVWAQSQLQDTAPAIREAARTCDAIRAGLARAERAAFNLSVRDLSGTS